MCKFPQRKGRRSMKLGIVPENLVERLALLTGMLPPGIFECWWEHCEGYVRTGEPLRVHQSMTEEEWGVYQRGMRSGIEMPARWVARHLPLPRTAQHMLDIGGSHGYFSVAICRRYPRLRATILDFPK